jgi:2-polyprenyl-6-methoxyphenol hydroxylase-like FAD-dependent oxidoreductase
MVKIVIIGAGIAGLSTYLFLRKHLLETSGLRTENIEIAIYEAYDIRQSNFNVALNANPTSNSSTWTSGGLSSGGYGELPQAVGSAIGISKNGLSVLVRLDDGPDEDDGRKLPRIIDQICLYGHQIRCWAMSTARGFKIVDADVVAIKARQDKSTQQTATIDGGGLYDGIIIARQSWWEILRDRVLEIAPDVVVKKKVIEVVIGGCVTKNQVIFEDGRSEEADLVIGADGLRSVVRQAMFTTTKDDTDPKETQSNHAATKPSSVGGLSTISSYLTSFLRSNKPPPIPVDYTTPKYEGLIGVGGFIPSSVLESSGHEPGTMAIVFGPNGFFGYGHLSSATQTSTSPSMSESETKTGRARPKPGPLAGFWSTFPSTTAQPFSSPTPPVAEILASLKSRHSSWRNHSIAAILNYLSYDTSGQCIDRHIYPTYTTPELPHWSKDGRVVLVGDAAHALQPSSGQGACLALEDAETLALMIRHFLSLPQIDHGDVGEGENSNNNTKTAGSHFHTTQTKALKAYETIRIPRVHKIHEHSQKMSRMKHNLSVVEEFIMYAFLYMSTRRWMVKLLSWIGVSNMEAYNAEVLGYDLRREVDVFLEQREAHVRA